MRQAQLQSRGKSIHYYIGVDSEPPYIAPARGPPLWEDCSDAQIGEGVEIEPADRGLVAQVSSDFEVDQRVNW